MVSESENTASSEKVLYAVNEIMEVGNDEPDRHANGVGCLFAGVYCDKCYRGGAKNDIFCYDAETGQYGIFGSGPQRTGVCMRCGTGRKIRPVLMARAVQYLVTSLNVSGNAQYYDAKDRCWQFPMALVRAVVKDMQSKKRRHA